MPKPQPKNKPAADAVGDSEAVFTGLDIGLNLLVSVIATGTAGYALDYWQGWAPWGMLAGGFLGFGAWLVTVWRVMKKA